jgi:PAS domain S-box-containing protein
VNELPGRQRAQLAEEALARSAKELTDIRYALDVSAIVAITDLHGDILYANDNFCEISKYRREELVGQNHRVVNSGYHPRSFFKEMWATIMSGNVWKGEIRNRAKDGSYYWVHTTIVPLLDENGRPEQYVSIRYDITDRKRLESELVRTAQMSLVGELVAGLAHEIKNPLAGVQGAIDIMLRRRSEDDPEREALENMRHEVQRIDATVRMMLDHARPRALSRASASLTDVVRRAVILVRDQVAASQRSVTIELDPGDEEITMSIDSMRLEDAVINLLLNAVEAIEGRGRIDVRLRIEPPTIGGPGEVVVEVVDTGRGIHSADLGRIFNPFFTTRSGGTGLGLPAVRRIVRAHGGRVDVVSEPGHGSCFTIRLPLEPH